MFSGYSASDPLRPSRQRVRRLHRGEEFHRVAALFARTVARTVPIDALARTLGLNGAFDAAFIVLLALQGAGLALLLAGLPQKREG